MCVASTRFARAGDPHSSIASGTFLAIGWYVTIPPKISQSRKCCWATPAATAFEFTIASTGVTHRRLVDMLIPIDFAATRTAVGSTNARRNTRPKRATRSDSVAAKHAAAFARVASIADHTY